MTSSVDAGVSTSATPNFSLTDVMNKRSMPMPNAMDVANEVMIKGVAMMNHDTIPKSMSHKTSKMMAPAAPEMALTIPVTKFMLAKSKPTWMAMNNNYNVAGGQRSSMIRIFTVLTLTP